MLVDSKLVTVDAADIIGQVQQCRRRELLVPSSVSAVRFHSGPVRRWSAASGDPPAVSEALAGGILALQSSLESSLPAAIAAIGEQPPATATLRGFFGRAVIRVLQSLLWWYTRSLRTFGEAVARQSDAELRAIEGLTLSEAEMRAQIAALHAEIHLLKEAIPSVPRSASE